MSASATQGGHNNCSLLLAVTASIHVPRSLLVVTATNLPSLYSELWANAQRDGRPAEYRWLPLFYATKFG